MEDELGIQDAFDGQPRGEMGTERLTGNRMGTLALLFVGDVMLGRGVNAALREEDADYPWGNTLSVFRSADLRIANLECVISDRGSPWPEKEFTFRSDARNVGVLKAAGIDAVSLANNHSLDFGSDALSDTLTMLDQAGIVHAGAGPDLAAAFTPGTLTAGGLKVALASFTDDRPQWEAGEHRPGIAYVPVDFEEDRATRLFDTIRAARRAADIVIVAAHWGPNWGYVPPPRQIPFAHRMIDVGADIVFGHSGHVFRGIEIYRDRPIMYCAGDFLDDYAVDEDERNDESFIFVVELDGERIRRLALYPTVIAHCQARMAEHPHAERIAQKMTRLCTQLGTSAQWDKREHRLKITVV